MCVRHEDAGLWGEEEIARDVHGAILCEQAAGVKQSLVVERAS